MSNTTSLEQLIDQLHAAMNTNNELLKENNKLQSQILEKLKKKKRCKSCKKD
jgi:hypothetical protein